ncbi:sensor histidine kinase [Curtobacterium flaccumfaciens]|uniref:sensor histidine kinase n=1 Tax=Curtobacterium flaccumfaciens TaxID=2035 RepID=UPI001BDE49FC|nr:HAMP domain-containing sensor histidine kinase [Curtobacterium flaccumfaciens]MBT1605161.1 HAMP domain-containing histidine kinase [Curtobacterium flaccumfaciens pv. betae]MBT1655735.1 HAMP domain-containing histidine kinase [Curtobacterium flaccumfaciens pv. betae]MCS0470619.1 HAMP domain-containing histidine kinase [Curtobacterium flaccumfaciens pv. betae]MCS0474295.1 HAMP domain-containing histidine kinase [Curtobacterium flaccumfaciens pv. betae]MCS0478512.1 HAMP domain-containing histi
MAERPVNPRASGPARSRPRRPRSVRARTTLGAGVVVLAALVIGAVAFVVVLRLVLLDGVRTSAEAGLEQVSSRVETDGAAAVTGYEDVLVQVIGDGGAVLAHGEDADGAALPTADESRWTHDGERWLLVADDVDLPGGGEATLVYGSTLDQADTAVRTAVVLLAVGVPVLVLVLVAVTWAVTGRSLRPVEQMRTEVETIRAARPDARVEVPDTGDEVARLASTMNAMLDRLELSAESQRRFVSDASHELRSPIASIRQHAEVAVAHPGRTEVADLADVVRSEAVRLQDLVTGLLELSRLDEGGIRTRRPVDLDDLALDAVARARARSTAGDAPARDGDAPAVRVDGSAISAARVLGDERVLAGVVRNLVDNAVRHASTRVAVSLTEHDGSAVLTVDDDGTGVPEDERERVFERFVRLDEARSRDAGGAGLGLAIVRDAVRAHGGDTSVVTSPLGGARFVVRIALGG